ncbi:MAG: potassium channel family protein [Nanoarchaeota archaeon]|nr:potassium channel family protein [Nanoarchaeota archaeon]
MDLSKRLSFAIVIFLILLIGSTFVYSNVEGWNYLDSLYFSVVTVTTLGYGDLAPQTNIGKIFTIFFSFAGIAIAFYFFALFGRHLFRKHLYFQMENAGRLKGKRGIKKVGK